MAFVRENFMKLREFSYYIVRDIFYRRTIYDVLCGVIAVAIVAMALLLINAFTKSAHDFIDICFLRARPVSGALIVYPASLDYVTKQEMQDFETLCYDNPNIEAVSWVSLLADFAPIYDDHQVELESPPYIVAVPYDSKLLQEAYGIEFLQGKNFENKPGRNFGILLNTKYLERHLKFSEKQIENIIRNKDFSQVPKQIYIHFWPIDADPKAFEPGTLPISVTGLFSLRDENFPEMFFTFDVASAFYFGDLEKFHASYCLQFNDQETGKPLVDPERYKDMKWKEYAIRPLPDKDDPNKAALNPNTAAQNKNNPNTNTTAQNTTEPNTSAQNKTTPEPTGLLSIRTFKMAWVWVKNYKQNNIRSQIKQDIQAVTGKQWEIKQPAGTVSDSLNRVMVIVNTYSKGIIIIMSILCFLCTLLFGLGHVHRKKKDIGLLKYHGMSEYTIGGIIILQVVLIALIGFILGFIFALGFGYVLEPYAQDIIWNLYPGYTLGHRALALDTWIILESFGYVLLASCVGGLLPMIIAARINPIDDLIGSL